MVEKAKGNDRLSSLQEKLTRAREEAAQEVNKLRTMIESMEEGVVIADADDVITEVNTWFLERFHVKREQVLGKTIWELHPQSEAVRSVRRLVEDCRNLVRKHTFVINRKLFSMHAQLRVQPVIEADQYKGVVLNVIDVTDLKETQERLQKAHDLLEERVRERTAELSAMNERLLDEIKHRESAEVSLRESEEKFRALFENAQDCIFMKDHQLRYTDVNPAMAELFERPISDLVGKSDEDFFEQLAARHLKEVDTRVLQGQAIEEEHTRMVNGRPIIFLDVRIPMRDNNGEIVGLYGIARNITERRPGGLAVTFAPVTEYPSLAMRSLLRTARTAARTDGNILLLGESGSGKDFVARYIHDHSARADRSFYVLNCAAVPSELAESELFGHESGAFTGARGRKRGLVELAEGGSLLLNEIGELSLPLQAKLLTFLDSKSFTRVGGERPISVDARILAATNRDLEAEMQAGRFRRDLFFRLHVLCLSVPPLRERIEDIPILLAEMMETLVSEMQLPEIPAVDEATVIELMKYSWPGNVREFRNVLERALMLWEGGALRLGPLGETGHGDEWSHVVHFPSARSLNELTQELKRSLVREALRRSGGNRTVAARMLGVTRYSLLRVVKRLEETVH
jgi:PAS domain S-box-containing protein